MTTEQTATRARPAPGTPRRLPDRAELAAALSAELGGSLNLRRTILRLLDVVRPQLADWAMLTLPGDRAGTVTVHGGTDPGFTATVTHTSIDELGIGQVLRSGRTELLHVALNADAADGLSSMIPHPALREEAANLRPADVLGLALTARGSTIGVLVLIRGNDDGYSTDDLALAEDFAGRAALALDSARLYEDRGRTTSVLQAGLRPPTLPDIPRIRLAARYRAADEHMDIGGDFYDAHGSGEDWLLVLGDVCGKGVEAAVLTGRTRQSIRTAAHFDRRPSRVLEALNSVLFEADSDRFVTVVCARLRPGDDGVSTRVDLAVAGHPAPVLVRADGSVEHVDAAAGTVAGVLPGIRYHETTVLLAHNDTMLMFTDGVYEARGADGFYGMDRLSRLLPAYAKAGPDAVCEAVEQNVVEYLGGRAHDDIALLAATCRRPTVRNPR